MMAKKFLFVCGCPRSGTTALANLLNNHPEICISIERYFRKILRENSIEPSLFDKERFLDYQEGDSFWDSLPNANQLMSNYDDATYIGEKLPRLYERFREISERFDNSSVKIINIVRDPVAVASSYNQRANNSLDTTWPNNQDWRVAIKDWCLNQELIEKYNEYLNILSISYEELFETSHKQGRRILDEITNFLGIDKFDENLIDKITPTYFGRSPSKRRYVTKAESEYIIKSTLKSPKPTVLKNHKTVTRYTKSLPLKGYFHFSEYSNVYVTIWGTIIGNEVIKESSVLDAYNLGAEFEKGLFNDISRQSIEKPIDILDKAVVITSRFDRNYQHFLIEGLPRIAIAIKIFNLPLIVTDSEHSREILPLLYPDHKFYFVSEKGNYFVTEKALFPSFINKNMCELHDETIMVLSKLANLMLQFVECNKKNIRLYITRKNIKLNKGNNRYCQNEPQLKLMLNDYDIKTSSFDGLSLKEKIHLISGASEIITPIDANVMNLIFAQNAERIILLTHNKAFPNPNWFKKLLESCCPNLKEVVLFDGVEIIDNDESVNVPYKVDIPALASILGRG